jgi:hypothetical protein
VDPHGLLPGAMDQRKRGRGARAAAGKVSMASRRATSAHGDLAVDASARRDGGRRRRAAGWQARRVDVAAAATWSLGAVTVKP